MNEVLNKKCSKEDCTVLETGICLESHDPITECPHYAESSEITESPKSRDKNDGKPVVRQFHSGMELGTQDLVPIMSSNYTHLISIIGLSNVGKTCFLSSLYLLASQASLSPDLFFAGSDTLQGFEARSRRMRNWEGTTLPKQLTEHTVLQDPRKPAFMHLALFDSRNNKKHRIDLALTDLPGEWFSTLINRAELAEQFEFLTRSDGLIFIVEGPSLANPTKKHIEIQNMKLLLQRLVDDVGVDQKTPSVILVSKCDLLNVQNLPAVEEINKNAVALGFRPRIIRSSSFSSDPEKIKSGSGILETILAVIDAKPPKLNLPQTEGANDRAFQRFKLIETNDAN